MASRHLEKRTPQFNGKQRAGRGAGAAGHPVRGVAGWTRDLNRAHRTARRLQAGTVWINTYHPLDAASPIGGYKQSGQGRELGRHALETYTKVKSVWVELG